MKILNIFCSNDIIEYYLSNKYYSMISLKQFLNYFLIPNYLYNIVYKIDDADICFWNMKLIDNSILNKNKINILISIENINYWGLIKNYWDWDGYKHYKKYEQYNDDKINIYYYNHIENIEYTNKYLSIPMINVFTNYYLNNYNHIKPSIITHFSSKKFCLIINKSNLNNDIHYFKSILNNIDIIDNIDMYNDYIFNKSCYNSIELLNVFNKYKFILCIENSYDNGYITEKIFNCFFSNSIPIYKGSPKINNYINEKSYIDGNNILNYIDYIKNIMTNENLFNEIINTNKILNTFNYHYNDLINNVIKKKINNLKYNYIGFWNGFTDNVLKNVLFDNDNNNYILSNNFNNIDILIIGTFLNENDYNFIIGKSCYKVIYISEPIEDPVNIFIYKIYSESKYNLITGCINDDHNLNRFKFPLYLLYYDYKNSENIFKKVNNYVKNCNINEKEFAVLINNHDKNNIRSPLYHKLKNIGHITCPSKLFNNCSNEKLNSLGNIEYIKNFKYNICSENCLTNVPGYITEKLLNCCLAGSIPLYAGSFDFIDEKIFNKNRILFYNPYDEISINNLVNKINYFNNNIYEFEIFYKQDVFCEYAYKEINNLEKNLQNKILEQIV
jgi:hypothetical protein